MKVEGEFQEKTKPGAKSQVKKLKNIGRPSGSVLEKGAKKKRSGPKGIKQTEENPESSILGPELKIGQNTAEGRREGRDPSQHGRKATQGEWTGNGEQALIG